jgi:hypothetical protein
MSCSNKFPTNRQLVFSSFFPFLKKAVSRVGASLFQLWAVSLSICSRQKPPDLFDDFSAVGKAFGPVFGKNESVAGRDVIDTAASRHQFRRDVQCVFNVGCQTGSPGLIVSYGTIGDFNIHDLLSIWVFPGIIGPETCNGCSPEFP